MKYYFMASTSPTFLALIHSDFAESKKHLDGFPPPQYDYRDVDSANRDQNTPRY